MDIILQDIYIYIYILTYFLKNKKKDGNFFLSCAYVMHLRPQGSRGDYSGVV